MKYFTKTTLLTCACLLAFASCKKSEDAPANNCSNNTLSANKLFITTGNWTLQSYTLYPGIDDGNGGVISDLMPYVDACQKDNYTHYYSDLSGFIDEGKDICSGNDERTPFTWFFTSDEKKINMDGELFDFTKIDANTMQISAQEEDDDGVMQTFTMGYKKN